MLHLRLRPGADAEPDRESVCVPRTQVKEIPSDARLQGSLPLFHRHQADDKAGGGGKALHPLQDMLQKKGGIICLPTSVPMFSPYLVVMRSRSISGVAARFFPLLVV